MEPPHAWTHWSDKFQLAIIAKENLNIDNLSEPEVPEKQIPIPEQPTEIRTRKKPAGKKKDCYEIRRSRQKEENKRQKKKFGGLRRAEADKKLKSILFLTLGNERKTVFSQKSPRVKILSISFEEIWGLLDLTFKKTPNVTFEW